MCGLRHESIQKRLLADKDVTFNKACDVAHAMELASRDTLELSSKSTTTMMDVRRLATARNQDNRFAETRQNGGQSPAQRKQPSNDPVRKARRSCTRCGEQHDVRTCPFRKAKCYECNRIRHLHKMCCNANTNFVGEEGSEFYGDTALGIHHITECGSGHENDVSVITLGQRTPKYMVTVDNAG